LKKTAIITVKILISAALLYVLFSRVNIEEFVRVLSGAKWPYVAMAALIFVGTQLAATFRWRTILKKDAELPATTVASIYWIGLFFNSFLPTLVGGDVIKGYYLYKKIKRGGVAVASIFMDRYSGYAALMLITAVALISGGGLLSEGGVGFVMPALWAVVAAFVAISAFMWSETLHGWAIGIFKKIRLFRVNELIDSIYGSFIAYKGRSDVLIKAFFLALVVQGGMILGYFVLAKGLNIDAGLGYFFLFVPAAITVSMAPVTFSGLGVREGAFVFLFTKAALTTEAEALGLSLLWFFITVVVSLPGAVSYFRAGALHVPKDFGEKAAAPGAK